MRMSADAWTETFTRLGAPRGEVEEQKLVLVRDNLLHTEAAYNVLRGRRSQGLSGDPVALVEAERAANGCPFCDPAAWHSSRRSLWTDQFGEVISTDGRSRASANWARLAPVSGLVFGDEHMHNMFTMNEQEFVALFDTGLAYARLALEKTGCDSFVLFENGGPKSAGTVRHTHVQVVGRRGRHFAYAERVSALGGSAYWSLQRRTHELLGLVRSYGPATAWLNVVPTKERDSTVLSDTVGEGARAVFRVLNSFFRTGTTSFSLAAILNPYWLSQGSSGVAYQGWPNVVWRLVDRGDMRAPHSDIGSAELFASTVVSTDPFVARHWLEDED
jgi:diadenosine tetraphosphate (Ap4A) HIT family hydrolase